MSGFVATGGSTATTSPPNSPMMVFFLTLSLSLCAPHYDWMALSPTKD